MAAHETKKNIIASLCDGSSIDRLSHAVILEGASRDERCSGARQLAQALVCHGDKKPCGVCGDCIKAAAGSHPDIIEITGGETARSFPVEKIREIKALAYILPNEADKKVFLLFNAGSMSEQSQNALLKILEEPPQFVSFILECGSKDVLLPTVLSRSTVYSLGEERTRSAVSEKKVQASKDAADRLILALCENNTLQVMKETSVFEKDKELFRLCLPEIIVLLRSALVCKYGQPADSSSAKLLSERCSASRIMKMIDIINDCSLSIGRNANHNLLITRMCASLTERN